MWKHSSGRAGGGGCFKNNTSTCGAASKHVDPKALLSGGFGFPEVLTKVTRIDFADTSCLQRGSLFHRRVCNLASPARFTAIHVQKVPCFSNLFGKTEAAS